MAATHASHQCGREAERRARPQLICHFHDGCPPDGLACHLCAHLQPAATQQNEPMNPFWNGLLWAVGGLGTINLIAWLVFRP